VLNGVLWSNTNTSIFISTGCGWANN